MAMDFSTLSRTIFLKAASRWKGCGVTPDVEAPITREALLAGKDPALDAAVEWIETTSQPRNS